MPRMSVGYSNLGRVYLIRNRNDEAIEVLTQGDKMSPRSWTIRYLLGTAYNSVKNYKKAETSLIGALNMRPDDVTTKTVLASVYDNLKKYDEADDLHLQILSKDPNNTTILNNYAYSLSVRGIMLKKALEMAQVAVNKSPDNPAYLDTLGWIYFKMGSIKKAQKFVKQSISLDDKSAEVLEHIGDIYIKMGEKELAKDFYQRALEAEEAKTTTIEKDFTR